ncbi:Dbl homology domain-containing protein [Imleria badia]|nr:Dbl homology domain-containing protein [Imleria badia]
MPRPTFHLPSDTEDDPRHSTDHDSAVDAARRYHALSELLGTELGYLLDLRTLVSVYLRLLPVLKNRLSHPPSSNPTIAYFARPPSSHGLYTYSNPHLAGSTSGPAVPHPIPPRVEKCTTRHLFSASDLDAITRNAEDILEFHERLVHRLRQVVSPFGISMTPRESLSENSDQSHRNSPIDVNRAISAVSSVFIDHASSFDQYQSFCSGHSEAFDIVRKVQHRYPAEWDAFELRCAALAAEMHLQDVAEDVILSSESGNHFWDLSKRRHSLSSLDALSSENPKAPILSASESGHTDRDTSSRRSRLMFMDYMIKPVQRVCRYPLLFDQLQERTRPQRFSDGLNESSSMPRDSQDTVKTALWTMRTVASLVDEARRQQDLIAKSVQIVSRITQGLLTSAATHNRPLQVASLTAFLSSLPPCYLSGSLDVIHYRGTNMGRLGTVRAKYLGAFLFPGGFLVLVKVAKSKAYEPKHWFNLRVFELVDSNLDDVLLPSWFRLSSKAHMFEFAASCRREKDIWVDAIRRAIAGEAPWSGEPLSSLRVDFTASLLENVQFDTISPLPTIQSIPELDDVESVVQNTAETLPVAQNASQIHLRVENPPKCDVTVPPLGGPSRRSSVAAHPAPMPESNTFHLVRSTASAREQVDRGLLDVFSEECLTARFHAHTHEEDLFGAQRVIRSFSRSTSALTMASAMSVAAKNRLTKRESVLVPRKKSFVEGNGMLGDTENCTTSAHSVVPKPMKRRQHPSKLKIVAMTKATSQEGDEGGNELALDSPSPMSHCSSVSFATPVTPLTIPTPLPAPPGKADSCHSHSEFLNVLQNDCAPKRSKSMIENVRGLFAPRPTSPTTALNREPSTRSSVSNSSLLRWWSGESLRRRVRSAPDVPGEELPSALTTTSLHVDAAPRPLLATTDRPYSQPDLHCLYSETTGSSTTEFGVDDPSTQKKHTFSSRGPQRRWTASALSSESREEDLIPVPTRIRRNFSFLHRFTQSTRASDDTPS